MSMMQHWRRLLSVLSGVAVVVVAGAAAFPANVVAASPPQQSGGSVANAIYKGPAPQLTSAEEQAIAQKNSRYTAWLAQPAGPTPFCIINPSGGCTYFWQVPGGGEYIQEPADEPNWCAPGAATMVYMHWNYGAVVNHGNETVPRDYHSGIGGNVTYSGGQGWMAWFAVHIGFSYNGGYRYGVMDQPYYNGANEYVVAAALDTLTNNYYHVVNTTSVGDLVGKTKYDVTVDGRPLDFFANAQFLHNWSGVGGPLNHSIGVYGLDQKASQPNYANDAIYYADSINGDTRGNAGDWAMSDNDMYYNALKTSAASGDITW